MILLAVSFHYVGCDESTYQGAHYLPPEAFGDQLRTLAGIFTCISAEALAQAICDKRSLPEHCCLVTLDDGLACQHETAFAVLKKLGIPAAFYVSGRPLAEHKALTVHKTHWLRSHMAPQSFLERLIATAESITKTPIDVRRLNKEAARQAYRYDDEESALVKYFLNYHISKDQNEGIIGALFDAEHGDETAFCRHWYMTPEQIREIACTPGYSIGAHGYSHRPLATLSQDAATAEMATSKKHLEALTGRTIESMSYPFGNRLAVSAREGMIAQGLGFVFGLTAERSLNRTLSQPHLLARLDAHDVPGGKSPLFTCERGVIRLTDEQCTPMRRAYGDESAAGVSR
jgi:peptidoglycan/xylan/chitin deacetylase (PgdA/CDA1 family)